MRQDDRHLPKLSLEARGRSRPSLSPVENPEDLNMLTPEAIDDEIGWLRDHDLSRTPNPTNATHLQMLE